MASDLEARGPPGIEVRADAWVALNDRDFRQIIDPTVDLAREPVRFGHASWILSLEEAPVARTPVTP